MSIHVALNHVTHYRYDRLVKLAPQIVRLRPAPHCRTRVLSYSQKIEPADHFCNWQQDPFANYMARLVFPEPTRELKVTIDLVAEMAVYNPFDFFLEPSAEKFPFTYSRELQQELASYLSALPLTPLVEQYLKKVDRTPRRTIDFLVDLNAMLYRDLAYVIRMEPGVQTPDETLTLKSGSCRDSGWLLVQLLRNLGLASRFASGYLIQLTPDVKSLDGPSGTEVDFTDLHAWCEVYLPGAGWIGLDPTSGLLAGEGHLPLACTPQPSSAAPIEGLVDPCEVAFDHTMKVSRIYEAPRVTKPYTDEQWSDILSLGEAVDRDLIEGDVRLTMGGEPTFVANVDRDAAEWNTAALGPTKRKYAIGLIDRLFERYGAGGALHFGQGKWYPGEQLPRWALSLFWRVDGKPIWKNKHRFANENEASKYDATDAQRLAQTLANKLRVSDDTIVPAYEDTFYYLWRERKLPINVAPADSRLADELERERLRKVFADGLQKVVGYVLPLAVDESATLGLPTSRKPSKLPVNLKSMWRTGKWHVRDGRVLLVQGDSAMGYRLPLDTLPWVAPADADAMHERDPFDERDELGDVEIEAGAVNPTRGRDRPKLFESAAFDVRTALCVEARDGRLYVFMPPAIRAEDYLALVAAIEAAAEALDVRITLEGYPPPRDPRVKLLQVTPDPGVVEVNIQPVASWRETVENTEYLYQTAFEERMCAEKFALDGRHTGTGGGNHFVLGGATPADSPFLRKPELLSSLIAYWHNHPSLSYLFSGLFIGPTSQAPRVDEARNDQLYELEIAIREIERARGVYGKAIPPWLVDRALRNILIDVTGNTHRSEFCIDKLYSPEGSSGRLGLLELRAFEMPPHARMSVVQQLLLRALVARFWQRPEHAPLTRWGTSLHDRFMLPTFVKLDFEDVLEDMRKPENGGYAFDIAWFSPHFRFRFPLYGEIEVCSIELSVRGALEPWHVMGEETFGGGTARFVDSSLERLEVSVTGLNDSRYTITANSVALPLQSTGIEGNYVAGVRYKAWNPPSALHPSINVHAPLTFDIVDTWLKKSIGGCQYHVQHPGGANPPTFPINAYDAESRRLARFQRMGHTPGEVRVIPTPLNKEYPFTLDLRRVS
jgi:uncharacterized protein (DUF2126 family)/transglutaminase-like putative cysteine protease